MMDTKRIFLYAALFFVSLSLWSAWQKEHFPRKNAVEAQQPAIPAHSGAAPTQAQPQTQLKATGANEKITLKSDVLELNVTRTGGDFTEAYLLTYQNKLNATDDPFALMTQTPEHYYVAESGLINATSNQPETLVYKTQQQKNILSEDDNKLTVSLNGVTSDGIKVTKTIALERGNYLATVYYELENLTNKPWQGYFYNQFVRKQPPKKGMMGMAAYNGGSISDPENKLYEKIKYKAMRKENLDRTVQGGWAAMQQHYFLTAFIPDANQTNRYYSRVTKNGEPLYTLGYTGPLVKLAPQQRYKMRTQLYLGPEITANLKEIAPGLDLTIDYGWLWWLADPLFFILKHIYQLLGNWGWAIIVLTLLIKLVFYKLAERGYTSMANMRRLQPKILALKERYADDKQKLSQATMELYRKEKINPLGGCLPILVQFPFLIALYYVLFESVELRHSPWILWIHDLSAPDPYYILPIIMGATQFILQKMTPAPADPMQEKIMLAMPIVFTFVFLHFPSGLVLYWVVNNVLSIAQQWYITKKIEKKTHN